MSEDPKRVAIVGGDFLARSAAITTLEGTHPTFVVIDELDDGDGAWELDGLPAPTFEDQMAMLGVPVIKAEPRHGPEEREREMRHQVINRAQRRASSPS